MLTDDARAELRAINAEIAALDALYGTDECGPIEATEVTCPQCRRVWLAFGASAGQAGELCSGECQNAWNDVPVPVGDADSIPW